ncbi:hypothetical protein IE81DRAFT_139554 [Ceraceosorus guamensis]|uniref:Uncharacterized protein n=1 Tax=Ceraceosorus guamensis TaxID=1522189 RepID=A0A316VX08_9BASI|nr:hypothetical protein IE81DRAFT_139554 [Ceraceosorus guamensis]PWN42187.1 hypothetical protein IE81DRAFT_139554 [Ceraceosorus guamensis]
MLGSLHSPHKPNLGGQTRVRSSAQTIVRLLPARSSYSSTKLRAHRGVVVIGFILHHTSTATAARQDPTLHSTRLRAAHQQPHRRSSLCSSSSNHNNASERNCSYQRKS